MIVVAGVAKKSSPLLLLCLLWSLVEVYSQTVPYVSFMGETLPNHGYVNFSLVGNDFNSSVQCHTDLSTCCTETQGLHHGDWIPPGSESRVAFPHESPPDVYEIREAQRVELHRRSNEEVLDGIYYCHIATSDVLHGSVRKSVYVGLYASGGIM